MKKEIRNIVWNKQTRKDFSNVYDALTNNGLFEDKEGNTRQLSMAEFHDVVTQEDILPLLPKVVTRVIMESIEPNLLIVPNLFTRLNLPQATHIEIHSIGALTAELIPAGGDFPVHTQAHDIQGEASKITVAKYGLAINIAQEVLDDNMFDIVTLWLRAAGNALARCKESQAIKLIDGTGITLFDNSAPTASELGIFTGRGITGAANGTPTLHDIFDMYTWAAMRGFVPDTLLINPLAWKTFMIDTQTREIVMNGAVLATRRMPLGSFTPGWPQMHGGLGLVTKATGTEAGGPSAWANTLNPLGATFNIPPSNVLPTPLKVIVTPLVPFTERSGQDSLVDIVMADSQRAGVLVQREEPTTSEADIFSNETHSIHVSERYGMDCFDQGKGFWIGRNAVAGRNYAFDNANSQTLAALPTTLASF